MNINKDDLIIIVLNYLKDIGKPVEDDTDLFSNGILDSLDIIDLVLFIEEKFVIKIPQDSMILDNFKTVKAISELINNELSK